MLILCKSPFLKTTGNLKSEFMNRVMFEVQFNSIVEGNMTLTL